MLTPVETETFEIIADKAKNRLYVYVKEVTEATASLYISKFLTGIEQLKPGFTGMTVVIGARLLAKPVQEKLKPTFDMAVQHGLSKERKWAYVSDSVIYKMQMRSLFGSGVDWHETVASADKYLD